MAALIMLLVVFALWRLSPRLAARARRDRDLVVTVAQATAVVYDQAEPEAEAELEPEPVTQTVEGDVDAQAGLFARLRHGLGRTSDNLVQGMGNLFLGAKTIDSDLLEELESRLLMADVGVEATLEIIDKLTQRVSRKELTRPDALQGALRTELLEMLQPCEAPLAAAGQ
ncbi:MAG: signal recognition particle receptor subunit alpha, partial [Halioglobus sp.]|nr:signal recognition particle receptor subunit alpha [Halioglobus sp.]